MSGALAIHSSDLECLCLHCQFGAAASRGWGSLEDRDDSLISDSVVLWSLVFFLNSPAAGYFSASSNNRSVHSVQVSQLLSVEGQVQDASLSSLDLECGVDFFLKTLGALLPRCFPK